MIINKNDEQYDEQPIMRLLSIRLDILIYLSLTIKSQTWLFRDCVVNDQMSILIKLTVLI